MDYFKYCVGLLLVFMVATMAVHMAEAAEESSKQQTFESFSVEPQGKTKKAYEFANDLVRDRLKQESEENIELLRDISTQDLIVVEGTYDYIQLVLQSLKLPFVQITRHQIAQVSFDPRQTVFVNCASEFPPEAARKLATFVSQGGQLITTDWALKNVLEVAFPGVVAYNDRPTGDEVVQIEVVNRHDPVVKGFLDEETQPVWWLEGSSYPIKVLDRQRVSILLRSQELKNRYGEEAVIIRFHYGEGIVYHMISHFYLQRTETRDAKQALAPSEYSKSKGASPDVQMKWEAEADTLKGLNYGDVQSANTSSEFILRAILNQKKRGKKSEPDNKNMSPQDNKK